MLLPGVHVPDVGIKYWDKFAHFFSYAVFTSLLVKGIYENPGVKNYLFLTAVISIGYGSLLELVQAVIPERAVDFYDLIANTMGCIVVLIIFPLIGKGE